MELWTPHTCMWAPSSMTLLFCLGLSWPCGCLLLSFAANSKPDSYIDIKNFSNCTSLTSVAMGTTYTVVLIGELMKQSEWDLGKEGQLHIFCENQMSETVCCCNPPGCFFLLLLVRGFVYVKLLRTFWNIYPSLNNVIRAKFEGKLKLGFVSIVAFLLFGVL
jgi:hypothetical protein